MSKEKKNSINVLEKGQSLSIVKPIGRIKIIIENNTDRAIIVPLSYAKNMYHNLDDRIKLRRKICKK